MTIFGQGFYCCLCFDPLKPEKCSITGDGYLEDVCFTCAEMELKFKASRQLRLSRSEQSTTVKASKENE